METEKRDLCDVAADLATNFCDGNRNDTIETVISSPPFVSAKVTYYLEGYPEVQKRFLRMLESRSV